MKLKRNQILKRSSPKLKVNQILEHIDDRSYFQVMAIDQYSILLLPVGLSPARECYKVTPIGEKIRMSPNSVLRKFTILAEPR
jgi:hypothetical protein